MDEAQFFDEEIVQRGANEARKPGEKRVIVAGLDMDFEGIHHSSPWMR